MINAVPEIIRAVDSWWGIMALGIIAVVAIVSVIVRNRKPVRAGSVRVSGDVKAGDADQGPGGDATIEGGTGRGGASGGHVVIGPGHYKAGSGGPGGKGGDLHIKGGDASP